MNRAGDRANRDSEIRLAKTRLPGQRDWVAVPCLELEGLRVNGVEAWFHHPRLFPLSNHERWCVYLHLEAGPRALDVERAELAIWGHTHGSRNRWGSLVDRTCDKLVAKKCHLLIADGRFVLAENGQPLLSPNVRIVTDESQHLERLATFARDVSEAFDRFERSGREANDRLGKNLFNGA